MQKFKIEITDTGLLDDLEHCLEPISQVAQAIRRGNPNINGSLFKHLFDGAYRTVLEDDPRIKWLADRHARYHVDHIDYGTDDEKRNDLWLYIHDDNIAMQWKLTWA